MDIFQRPPSVSWESVVLRDLPGATVWAWIRPPAAPAGIVFQIPTPTYAAFPDSLTVRRLLHGAGIDSRLAISWTAFATHFDAMRGTNPLLDQPLMPALAGIDPSIIVHLTPPVMAPAMPVAAVPVPQSRGAMVDRGSEALYSAIEADWNAIRILEAQLVGLRKQLNTALTKLLSLNRDLSPDERLASDNLDTRDWQDARRWLRDGAAVLSRVVKAYDIGVTSSAGNRNKFDDLIDQYVKPRRPLEALAIVQQQFESHRKTVQSLQAEMQSAMNGPGRDGEMKANAVLNRIRGKMRGAKGKR